MSKSYLQRCLFLFGIWSVVCDRSVRARQTPDSIYCICYRLRTPKRHVKQAAAGNPTEDVNNIKQLLAGELTLEWAHETWLGIPDRPCWKSVPKGASNDAFSHQIRYKEQKHTYASRKLQWPEKSFHVSYTVFSNNGKAKIRAALLGFDSFEVSFFDTYDVLFSTKYCFIMSPTQLEDGDVMCSLWAGVPLSEKGAAASENEKAKKKKEADNASAQCVQALAAKCSRPGKRLYKRYFFC
uniref:Putative secreted protein n=1 Tax=Amblyomma triste TaxID=251400 RepID=A0A023G3D0_AMBTT